MNKPILRGNLYYADLNPVIGSEQGGIRPVLVIQNNIGNKFSPTIIIASITSKATKSIQPTHHILSALYGLDRESIVLLEQIRTIDKQRLRSYVGVLGSEDMQGVESALALSVGLHGSPGG